MMQLNQVIGRSFVVPLVRKWLILHCFKCFLFGYALNCQIQQLWNNTIQEQIYSNLPVKFTTWIWAVCANLCGRCELSSCAFNCISKEMLISRANVWRLINALTEANCSFCQGIEYLLALCYSLHKQSMLGEAKRLNNWVTEIGIRLYVHVETAKSSNWSKLTKHRTTLWSEAAVRKFNLIYLFIADKKSIVWTHTLCRTQVDKNRQYRT